MNLNDPLEHPPAVETPAPESAPAPSSWDTVAAIDLGSNSFHMIIAQVDPIGHLRIVDRLREQVQLGAGLDDKRYLTPEVQTRALACLARFSDRVRDLQPGRVRAAGTNTLRRARNSREFLEVAQQVLGHPIEVIAGREEARLIYLGVAHTQADDKGRRLVIDIGGGSTEFIIGERFAACYRESLEMGCVSTSLQYFPQGQINEKNLRRAELAAHLELRPIEHNYRRIGWDSCIGASGTIKAIESVLLAHGWSQEGISLKGLYRIRKLLLKAGAVSALEVAGLSRERGPTFPGGVAILTAAFEALDIEQMRVSDGALREGLLYELLGRIFHEDVRERTILAMARRYHVSLAFAARVATVAEECRRQVAEVWQLNDEETVPMLRWAAHLHEIGLAIAHNQYHKHGAYLAYYSDMPGFTRQKQQLLAVLIRGHRRKFPKGDLADLPPGMASIAERLCILLRLAVLLNQGRRKRPHPAIQLVPGERSLQILFPAGWLAGHPLTRANLEREVEYLKGAKFTLQFE